MVRAASCSAWVGSASVPALRVVESDDRMLADALLVLGDWRSEGGGKSRPRDKNLCVRLFGAMLLAADEEVMERNGWVRAERLEAADEAFAWAERTRHD